MSYLVLARKWRPETFQEVVGQEHITQSLQHALLRNRLGHAYLFTGTRGIGKTSVARIFARALRCFNRLEDGNPCGKCDGCKEAAAFASMNVIEIDGASNNSVEDIRDLVGKVQALPSFGKYRIYIIDEVHALSTSAFNALLKTLEEPPPHIVFILATTTPEKILDTILSRCQRFDFRNASLQTLTDHLKIILKKEGIEFGSDELLKKIAVRGGGSFRDTLSLVDQVLSFAEENKIDEELVATALGLAQSSSIKGLSREILNGNVSEVGKIYRDILRHNVAVENICRDLLDYFYHLAVNPEKASDFSTQELFWVYQSLAYDFAWVLKSISPDKSIEIVLHKVSLRRTFFASEQKQQIANVPKKNKIAIVPVSDRSWSGFLQYLRGQSPVIASNLEQGNIIEKVDFKADKIRVLLGFKQSGKIFYDYLQESAIIKKLKDALAQYARKGPNEVTVELSLIEESANANQDFKTRFELEMEEEKAQKQKREETLLNDPVIKQAEQMFNTKIDQINIFQE